EGRNEIADLVPEDGKRIRGLHWRISWSRRMDAAHPHLRVFGSPIPGENAASRRVRPGMRLSVVGLGPGPSEWIAPAATTRLRNPGARVFARTRFFPNLAEILEGVAWESFDGAYETAASFDDVNATIAD